MVTRYIPMTSHKAWVAAVIAGLASFVATVQGRTDVNDMTAVDWIIVVVSAIVAGLTVYVVPNQPRGDAMTGVEDTETL